MSTRRKTADPVDLISQIETKMRQLEVSVRKLRETGTAFAEAERDYKVLLNRECLKLRDSGMAVGMIDKVCYGIQSVADARFNRDVAEATWRANIEAINSIKLQIKILDAQVAREWGLDMSR